MARPKRAAALTATALVVSMTSVQMAARESEDEAYRAEIEQWRRVREEALKADDGWLTVAALHWLHEGTNTFGADPSNDFILPAGPAPPFAGAFHYQYQGGRTTVTIRDGVAAVLNGSQVSSAELRPGPVDTLVMGPLSMWVHRSGSRDAIRLRDLNSSIRMNFRGLRWFPIDEQYRLRATLVRHASPVTVNVPNVLGDIERYTSPGNVTFRFEGQDTTLLALLSGDRLWFLFRDQTSGKETYPAVRFLYAPLPDGDDLVLDFNMAVNPPCAYNPFTTCPLPPPQNRLRVRIEAGEMNYQE